MMKKKRSGGPRKTLTNKKSSHIRAFTVAAACAISACAPVGQDDLGETGYIDYSHNDCRHGSSERPWESLREPYLEYAQDGDITDDCHSEANRQAIAENICSPMSLFHTLKSYSDWHHLDFYGEYVIGCVFAQEHEINGQVVPNTLWNTHEEQLTTILSDFLAAGTEVSYWLVGIFYETSGEDYHPIAREVSKGLLWNAFEGGSAELKSYAATKLWALGNQDERVLDALLDGLAIGEHPFITDMFAASRIHIDAESAVQLILAGTPEPAAMTVLAMHAEQERSIPSAMEWVLRIDRLSNLAVENPEMLPSTVDLLERIYRYQGEEGVRAHRHLIYHQCFQGSSDIDSEFFLNSYHREIEGSAPNRLSVISSLETILQSGHVQTGSDTEDRILRILVSAVSDPSEEVARLARCVLANS